LRGGALSLPLRDIYEFLEGYDSNWGGHNSDWGAKPPANYAYVWYNEQIYLYYYITSKTDSI